MVVARDWGRGSGELVSYGHRVSVLQDKTILEMDDGAGYTIM